MFMRHRKLKQARYRQPHTHTETKNAIRRIKLKSELVKCIHHHHTAHVWCLVCLNLVCFSDFVWFACAGVNEVIARPFGGVGLVAVLNELESG